MRIAQRPPEWSDNTWSAWCAILNLNPDELMMLKNRIKEEFGPYDDPEPEGGAGVREPRRPLPSDPLLAADAKSLPGGDVDFDFE